MLALKCNQKSQYMYVENIICPRLAVTKRLKHAGLSHDVSFKQILVLRLVCCFQLIALFQEDDSLIIGYPIKFERKLFNTHFALIFKLPVAILSLGFNEMKTAVHFELGLMPFADIGNRNFF